jgi:hypothetical protein
VGATPSPRLREAVAAELQDSSEGFEIASVALEQLEAGLVVWVIVEGDRPGRRRRWQVPLEYGGQIDAGIDHPEGRDRDRAAYFIAVHLEEWWHAGPRGRATRLPTA